MLRHCAGHGGGVGDGGGGGGGDGGGDGGKLLACMRNSKFNRLSNVHKHMNKTSIRSLL